MTQKVTDLELCFNPRIGEPHTVRQLRRLPLSEQRPGKSHEEVAATSFAFHRIDDALRSLAEQMTILNISQATIKDSGHIVLATNDVATAQVRGVRLLAQSPTMFDRLRRQLVPSLAVCDKPTHACVTDSAEWGSGVFSWHRSFREAHHNALITGGTVQEVDADGHCRTINDRAVVVL